MLLVEGGRRRAEGGDVGYGAFAGLERREVVPEFTLGAKGRERDRV